METRQRNHDETRPTPLAPAAGSALEHIRANADRLLAVGSDAIDRALSSDSRAFLEANRQEGGQ